MVLCILRIAKRVEACSLGFMKKLCVLLLFGMALASCNTTIGVGRDVRDGYQWTKGKIQESRNNRSYDHEPPVY